MLRVALIIAILLLPGWAYAAELDPFGFSEDDYSSWGIVDAPYPYDPAELGQPNGYGCFPVGNGQVFAYLGVDGDFNTLRGITGPGYQTRDDNGNAVYWEEGEWPDQTFELWRMDTEPNIVDGEQQGSTTRYTPLEWTAQSTQPVRGTAMVRTRLAGPEGELYCLTYAVAGRPGIAREFAFIPGEAADEAAHYAISTPPGSEIVSQYDAKQWFGYDGSLALSAQHTVHGAGKQFYMFSRDARSISRCNLMYQFRDHGSPAFMRELHEKGFVGGDPGLEVHEDYIKEYRATTAHYWQSWSAESLHFDTGDPRLDDLMIQLPVIIETQRDAYSGGTAPMVSYHGYWVRDSLGPMLTYLANGRYEEVMRMLRYHRAACLKLGFCHMLVPLDLDLSGLEGWQEDGGAGRHAVGPDSVPVPRGAAASANDGHGDPSHPALTETGTETRPTMIPAAGDLSGIGTSAADWEAIGVEHAEVPSLIVLQHYWLWRALHYAGRGEEADAFIAEAWPFIQHNLFAMQLDPDFGVRFHGDETYTHGSLYSTYDRAESGQIGYPNGYIPTEFFSFDNALLHSAACRGAYFMAERLFRPADTVRQLDEMPEELQRIGQLASSVDSALAFYRRGHVCFPAISSATYQPWPAAFANLSLGPWSLPVEGGRIFSEQYLDAREQLHCNQQWEASGEPAMRWWTTPWSGYATGHSLGGWLNAARINRDDEACSELVELLLTTASPEGAWCEVLSPDGLPVDIYGRTNRIRPWESGINYLMLAAYLAEQGLLAAESQGRAEQLSKLAQASPLANPQVPLSGKEWHRAGDNARLAHVHDYPSPPPYTQLLVLTVDNHYCELIGQDERLKHVQESAVAVWDAGLPFSHKQLRDALIGYPDLGYSPSFDPYPREPGIDCRIPFLYIDREVRGGLDRRTFKDEDFWQGAEMSQLLADYEAAGGTVIDEDSLELSLSEDEAVALRLLVVFCTHTFTHQMTADEIATFHQEMAEWVSWYDEVGDDRLRLELDYLQVDQRLSPGMCGPQGQSTYWMDYDDVEGLLSDRGIPENYYDSVCCFWAWDRDLALPGGEKAAQAYGGAAQGPADDMDFLGSAGRTSYFGSAVLVSHPDRTSKNATHEYLHNVDAMFEQIGDSRVFHPDHMARNMEQLLREVPGGFEQHGFSDDEMRAMVAAELRNEIHFPWRTQLVYYRQALERIPRADYARLLRGFGRRVQLEPRTRLYERLILPAGAEAMQLWWYEAPGAEPVELADSDFSEGEQLIWEETLWAGAPDGANVSRYGELELLSDDVIEYVIGPGQPLSVWLTPTGSGEGLSLADVWAQIGGEEHYMWCVGDGAWVCDVPPALGERTPVVFHADAEGYACSPVPVVLQIRPPWELSAQFRTNEQGDYGLFMSVDGPPGSYKLSAEMSAELNTIQRRLADDGLLYETLFMSEVELGPGGGVALGGGFGPFETAAYPLNVRVDYVSDEGQASSFVHNYPAPYSLSGLLKQLDPAELPAYIPVVQRHFALPGTFDHGPRIAPEHPVVISPDDPDTHIFAGSVDHYGDASMSMRLMSYEEYLLIECLLWDDTAPTGGVWSVDRINLVFDAELNTTEGTYPDGPVGHNGWERDDYWVFLAPFAEGGPLSMRLGGERPSGGKNGYYGEVEGSSAEVQFEDGRYVIHWRIPWDSLPYLDYEPGRLVGFSCFLSDYDESLSELMYLTDWGGAGGIEWRFWDCGLLYFE